MLSQTTVCTVTSSGCELDVNCSVLSLSSQLLSKNLYIAQNMISRRCLINIHSNTKEARIGAEECFVNEMKGVGSEHPEETAAS